MFVVMLGTEYREERLPVAVTSDQSKADRLVEVLRERGADPRSVFTYVDAYVAELPEFDLDVLLPLRTNAEQAEHDADLAAEKARRAGDVADRPWAYVSTGTTGLVKPALMG